jgi:outer membrane protein
MISVNKLAVVFVAVWIGAAATAAQSETISGALAKAYETNSQINSARAGVRVRDEGVAIAKSGYRPQVSATGDGYYQSQTGSRLAVGAFGVSVNQMIFDGFQTRNSIRAAKAQVLAQREALRNTVQNILFNGAAAYMDVIRDRRIAELRQRNLAFLTEQVRASQARLDVGEGTRTDVSQAEAARSNAVALLNAAKAQALSSEAVYRQVVGSAPGKLAMATPVNKLLPISLDSAFATADARHPAILSARHSADSALWQVKVQEGQFLPSLNARAGLSRTFTNRTGVGALGITGAGDTSDNASIGATLTVPIYQGGAASAGVRQAKETQGQAEINVDGARTDVRAAVASAWAQYQSAAASVQANRDSVSAAQLALDGIIEERNVGQRTTLDVLITQASLIENQISLASAERNAVVSSYAVLSATGELDPAHLGLHVSNYDPEEHLKAVEDKWYGLRTPDGR